MVKKVYCPRCGHVEKNLYLEETGGWFLCSHCHTQVKIEKEKKESWEREEPDIMEDKGIDGFM